MNVHNKCSDLIKATGKPTLGLYHNMSIPSIELLNNAYAALIKQHN